MFASLLGALVADVNRQVGWAKDEARRQTRHTALTGALAGVAALAALGAVVVGLIALDSWLAMRVGPFAALGLIGGGLLLVAVILFVLAFGRRRPRLASRPPLLMAQSAALLGALRRGSDDEKTAGNEQTSNPATDPLRHDSQSTLLVTLVLAALAGLIAGRRL
jgi:hypothetical protein